MSMPLLEVEDLHVTFATRRGLVQAVRGVSFSIFAGEKLGIVGESGSGKSVTANAVMGLVKPPGYIDRGTISWRGRSLSEPTYAKTIRGKAISFIPQNPVRSLNPLATVGAQIGEVLRIKRSMSRSDANHRSVELLRQVGIALPERRLRQLPHELSGGMCQRVLIAMALAVEPALLIADEPTTALDVTIQAQLLDLLDAIQEERNLAVLLITHDLGVIARLCRSTMVLYSGRVVERAPVEELFRRPGHPYSRGLLHSMPTMSEVRDHLVAIPGVPPDPVAPPTGCPFHPRCELARDRCLREMPPLERHDRQRWIACWEAPSPRAKA
jgi:peptide/nickel transport system ATP-binding protein